MKQDPSRGGGSTLSPAYSAALERLAKKRLIGDAPLDELPQIGNAPPGKRSVIGGTGKGGLGIVGDAFNMAKGIVLSPVATVADIAWKPFEAIPGAPDFNPEDAGTFNIFVQGGKSLQHVYGDAKELGRSIITGKDTLSQSPSAKTYQAAGGGLEGALMAAAPYLDVGSVVAPMAMGAARGAGLVAPKPVPYTPLTVADLNVARETFGAPTNAYRTTRKALAEDMAQAMTADELRNFAEKVAGSTQQVANLDNGLYGVWGDDPLINDRLRGDYLGTDVDEQIKLAQEFFTRVPPLQRPVKAFRGIMVERPEAGTNAFSDFVRTWEVGDVIEEPGFMSTTIDRNIAEGYANGGRVIEIDIPKGTQVATPEMFGPALRSTEQELTLPPGTKLQITSIADDVIKAKVVPSDTPITKMQTTRDALLRYVDPEVTAPQAGRVAPGFITSEPVPVGNIGKLPSGVDVELATPEQSVAFVAEQGSLDQVPTEHLWQTITENSGPGKRFEQIGGGGGATGMDRFRDTVTGQQMGLKHVPGEQNLVANGFIARTFFETLSDDVGSAVGIPRMGVRTVVNSDGSVSLVTELAQSVYDGEIMDSFQAMTRSPDGAPALGNRVTVNSRIRKALLDDLLENGDVHDGNQLFVINNDGTVDIIPIDLEHTFSSMQSVLNPQNLISKVFSVDDVREIRWGQFSDVDRKGVENWSLRNRIVQDTDNLRDEIQAVIKTVQQQLSVDNLEREMKLRIDEIGRSYQRVAGANSANLDKFLKQASQTVELFMTRIRDFLDTPAKDIADTYIKAIEAGVFA